MARSYHTRGVATVGTDKSAVSLIAATTVRGKIYEFLIGSAATPGDQAANWAVQRFTADGTGTAFTPIAIDPADPAALCSSKSNYSAEPTVTANAFLFQASVNQRATLRWIAAPGKELVIPATSGNGAVVKTAAATGTAVHEVGAYFEE